MGDRLATIDMDRKVGMLFTFVGGGQEELGPHVMNVDWDEAGTGTKLRPV